MVVRAVSILGWLKLLLVPTGICLFLVSVGQLKLFLVSVGQLKVKTISSICCPVETISSICWYLRYAEISPPLSCDINVKHQTIFRLQILVIKGAYIYWDGEQRRGGVSAHGWPDGEIGPAAGVFLICIVICWSSGSPLGSWRWCPRVVLRPPYLVLCCLVLFLILKGRSFSDVFSFLLKLFTFWASPCQFISTVHHSLWLKKCPLFCSKVNHLSLLPRSPAFPLFYFNGLASIIHKCQTFKVNRL